MQVSDFFLAVFTEKIQKIRFLKYARRGIFIIVYSKQRITYSKASKMFLSNSILFPRCLLSSSCSLILEQDFQKNVHPSPSNGRPCFVLCHSRHGCKGSERIKLPPHLHRSLQISTILSEPLRVQQFLDILR